MLHVGREFDIYDVREMRLKQIDCGKSQFRGRKAVFLFGDIAPFLDRVDNRSVGAGAPNPQLFHGLDQHGFREPGRRLRKMLTRIYFSLE